MLIRIVRVGPLGVACRDMGPVRVPVISTSSPRCIERGLAKSLGALTYRASFMCDQCGKAWPCLSASDVDVLAGRRPRPGP